MIGKKRNLALQGVDFLQKLVNVSILPVRNKNLVRLCLGKSCTNVDSSEFAVDRYRQSSSWRLHLSHGVRPLHFIFRLLHSLLPRSN